MQINTAPTSDGVRWVTEGFKLFLKQPLALPAMAVIYFFMHMPAVVPVVGLIVVMVLKPFAVMGMMTACRDAAAGRMPAPSVFFTPFRDAAQRRQLLRLGLANAVLGAIALAIVLLAGVDERLAVRADATPTTADIRWGNLGWQFVIFAPITLVMWFAPMLAAWHGASPGKAMFGSAVACWRNKSPLLVFLLATTAALLAVTMVAGALIDSAGASPQAMSMLAAPLSLLVLAVVEASVYVMYTDVFERP